MKKIDKLLITNFLGPFAVSFGIALFVLVMQFLWLYIDEIAGKGVNIITMAELLGYLSVATFPMALPIAILISSVMVMGNLAERYELSSMKSAGVSLLRIMMPLIFAAALVSVFSWFCSDTLIPVANLKFKSRLHDIRNQKLALAIEEGIFNEDFGQFVMRVGKKEADGETIHEVMIDDQSGIGNLKFNQILADSGQMYTSEDKRFFAMHLFNGSQYQEPNTNSASGKKQKYPFIRTNFKSWRKVWDMREFDMKSTDEDRFKNHRSMLTMKQLAANVDSLYGTVEEAKKIASTELLFNLQRLEKKANMPKNINPIKPTETPKTEEGVKIEKVDSLKNIQKTGRETEKKLSPQLDQKTPKSASATAQNPSAKQRANKKDPIKNRPARKKIEIPKPSLPAKLSPAAPKQILEKPLADYNYFWETFKDGDRKTVMNDGMARLKGTMNSVAAKMGQITPRRLEAAKTGYELYSKYSMALVCFIFMFIGAPMGAIIRKGGFGYPILVSIIFFVIFITLMITCRKLAETFLLTPFWASMVPCIILLPVATILTVRAMNDSQLFQFDTDRLRVFWSTFAKSFRFRKEQI